jgi:large subunit ribosomal protein L22
MEFKAEQKYMLLSPRKVRPVVVAIKKLTPKRALEVLPFIKRRASETLLKVIKSAVANANTKNVDLAQLTFKEIQIGEGPRLKRGQPVSRGRWHPIKKRMSHIRVILQSADSPQTTVKKVAKKAVVKTGKDTKNVA